MHVPARHVVASLVWAALVVSVAPPPAQAADPDDIRAAAAALAREAADLLALHAFPPSEQTNALTDALQGLPLGTPTTGLGDRLKRDDAAGAAALTRLVAAGRTLSRETGTALAPLTAEQLASVRRGGTLDLAPGLYLEALEDLTARDGARSPTAGSRPDPPGVNAALADDLRTPAESSGRMGRLPWVVAGVIAVGLVGSILLRPRRPSPITVPAAPVRQPAPAVHAVLDASRRLTTLTHGEDVSRAVVREALSLVPSRGAALVERRAEGLVLGHESQPGLLRPEGFGEGVVHSVAQSGQLIAQMVTADPSFPRLPAQVLALPLVSSGRVDAVLVAVRDPMETFTPAERDLLATFGPVAAGVRDSAARTQAAVDASQIDPLTGAGNRRQLDTHLQVVLREAEPTGFFMIDLDHFKSVNDRFGHPAGDAMLRQVCATIRGAVRPTDGVYRYGGEEFCVLLPATTVEETADIAERVRAAIEAGSYDIGTGEPLSATASVGVAATDRGDAHELIAHADRALYDAKAAGRNRVCRA